MDHARHRRLAAMTVLSFPGPPTADGRDAAAADDLRAAWVRVAALLAHVADECAVAGSHTRASLAALGRDAVAQARRQALLQRAHLLGAACRAGLPLRDAELADAAAALVPRDDIVDDYAALARAFDAAARTTALHGREGLLHGREAGLVTWLHERARLHRAHAALLGSGMVTSGPGERAAAGG